MNVAVIVPYEGKQRHQQDYDAIIQALEKEGATVISAEKSEPYQASLEQNKALHPAEAHYNFIRKAIIDSDAVVVEVTHEDFQMGHEMTLALLYRKPVLALSKSQDHTHYIPHPDFQSKQYMPGQIPHIIRSFIAGVKHRAPTVQPNSIVPGFDSTAKAYTQKSIAVVGGVSADIFNKVKRIPGQDEVELSKAFKISLGGKATNAAVAMARLGNEVLLLGQIGHDSIGVDLEAVLIHEGVKTDFLARHQTYPTGTVVLAIDDNARYSTVVNEAANVHLDKETIDQLFKRIDAGQFKLDCLYLTLEPQPAAIEHIIREADKRNVFIFCDAAPHARPLDPKLLHLINIIAPNQIEAQAMTGVHVTSRETAEQAADIILKQGAREVIITLGAQGAYYTAGQGNSRFIPAYDVKAVDEAGAGDAFRAAFVTELLASNNTDKALDFGAKAGAFAVTRFGSYDSMPRSESLTLFA
jgi:ribokinase